MVSIQGMHWHYVTTWQRVNGPTFTLGPSISTTFSTIAVSALQWVDSTAKRRLLRLAPCVRGEFTAVGSEAISVSRCLSYRMWRKSAFICEDCYFVWRLRMVKSERQLHIMYLTDVCRMNFRNSIWVLRNAARFNPRRHRGGGGDATLLRFFCNIFFVHRSNITIFSIAFRQSFYVPLKTSRPWLP